MTTGTVIAQAVPILISPLLTRLYTPTDYGVYGTFMLVAYTISAFASARYEWAIGLPEEDDEAAKVLALSLLIGIAVSTATFVVTLVLHFAKLPALEATRLGPWLLLLAPNVFLMSAYQTLNFWVIRKQQFRRLSISRVFRSLAMGVLNIGLGFVGFGGGLVVSSILGQAVATAVLASQLLGEDRRRLQGTNRTILKALARRFRQFPLFALPADLLATSAFQLPVVFLDTASAGIFTFVQTVVNAPLAVVAGSVHDAFKERVSRDWREERNFRAIFVRLTRVLVFLAFPGAAVLIAFGPSLFALVFGEQWRRGGEFARIFAMMSAFRFLAAPLCYAYLVVEKQREDFLLQVYIAASTALILALGKYNVIPSVDLTLGIFATNYVFFYMVRCFRSYQFSGGDSGNKPLVDEPTSPTKTS